MIREWSRGQWVLRGVVVGGPLVALLLTGVAGAAPAGWLVAAVLALALANARLPESPAGTAAAGIVVASWALGPDQPLGGSGVGSGVDSGVGAGLAAAVVAAAALVAAHVAALLAAQGPDGLGLDPPTVRLWVRRGTAVCLLAPLAAGLVVVLHGRHESIAVWMAGLAVALVVAAGTSAVLSDEGE